MDAVEAYYYTDPACPWSWALEPALRRLEHEFDASVRVRYVMAGMAREFGDPDPLVRSALEAGLASGMPVDPRLWWESPPHSSYPACVAVKAAAEQGDPGPYLRRLREGLLARRRKLDSVDALIAEAQATGTMDVARLRIDLNSHAVLEGFASDLERARAVAFKHQAPGSGRVKLPSLEFRAADGSVHGVYDAGGYEALRDAAMAAGAQPQTKPAPSLQAALQRWGSMATMEVAEACRLPGPRAPAELWTAASEWRVVAHPAGTGHLWTLP